MPAPVTDASSPILRPGHSCAELARADRVAVLVDGEAYMRRLATSLVAARRQAIIVGWDMDPTVALWRGDDPGPTAPRRSRWRNEGPLPPQLGALLDELVRRNRRLHCLVLVWDFGTLMAVKRRLVPVYHLDWNSHRRVKVRLDGAHPLGSSMHIKATVIDDRIAYVGGIDLSRRRWDRPGHDAADPLRIDPDGRPYAPWHDLQLAVSGPAAASVGRYLRGRWRLATGQRAPAPLEDEADPWPRDLRPDLADVDVGILRTEPDFEGRRGVREIEAAFLAAVASARRTIYIENQYITSRIVAEALARRLAEPDGPEVIIVTSARSSGFLEQAVMDGHRRGFLRILREADAGKRLRLYWSEAAPGVPVKIHAKSMIVDDHYLQLGSANLANRSMGMDVELDMAIEARGAAADRVAAFLRQHRAALLAEHQAMDAEDLQRLVAAHGSVRAALDQVHAQPAPRGLRPLEPDGPGLEVPQLLGDPERSVDLTSFSHRLVPEGLPRSLTAHAFRLIAGLVVIASLEAIWHGLPHSIVEDPTALPRLWLRAPALDPLSVGATILAFIGASVIPFPMALLVFVAGFAYGTGGGFGLTIIGTGLGCVLGWAVGAVLGRRRIGALGLPRINTISHRLAKGGLAAIADLRLSPRHSFADVNLASGALGVGLLDLLPGTVLGGVPGALLFSALGSLFAHALRSPGPVSALSSALCGLVSLGLLALLWRRRSVLSVT